MPVWSNNSNTLYTISVNFNDHELTAMIKWAATNHVKNPPTKILVKSVAAMPILDQIALN